MTLSHLKLPLYSVFTMVKKLKELSNLDINKMCKKIPGYGGCLSKNELPANGLPVRFFVINMEDSDKGGGTHWVMLDNRKPSQVVYMDSMGEVPPTKVKKLMNGTKKKQVINRFELQPMGSVTCGWYCVAAAKVLTNHDLKDFIDKFSMSDFKKNDVTLRRFF
jgi:hypothetical protein